MPNELGPRSLRVSEKDPGWPVVCCSRRRLDKRPLSMPPRHGAAGKKCDCRLQGTWVDGNEVKSRAVRLQDNVKPEERRATNERTNRRREWHMLASRRGNRRGTRRERAQEHLLPQTQHLLPICSSGSERSVYIFGPTSSYEYSYSGSSNCYLVGKKIARSGRFRSTYLPTPPPARRRWAADLPT